jgi:hypothetical protein
VAERATPRRARHGRAGIVGCVLIAGAAATSARGQTPFLGDVGLDRSIAGVGRPASPFQAPLLPGQTDTLGFWRPDLLPDVGPGRPPAGAPPQPFSILPSLTAQGAYTDNLFNSATNKQSDFYVTIIPTITAAADTSRLVGAITYAPRIRFYADESSQNRIDQFLRAQGTATLVEDRLFLQASAVGDAQSVFGDFPGAEVGDSTQNQIQTTSYQISPYYIQRFGDIAQARVGYVFRQTIQSGDDAFAQGASQPFFTSTDFISNQVYASLNSGESWGRFGWGLNASATEFSGSGIYDGAYNRLVVAQLRYALTREFAVVLDGGWQRSFYNGVTPFRVDAPVWAVGFRYAPDETGFLTVRYGQYDDAPALFVLGALDIGVRTRLFVTASQIVTNSALLSGNILSSMRVDALGNLVESGTGVPAAIAFGTPLQAQQSGLFRTQRASVGVSQTWARDTVSLALTRSEQDPVAVAAGTTAFKQDSTSVSVGWTHALEPGMNLTTGGRYGVTESEGFGRQVNYSLNAILSRSLTPSLAGALQYQFTSRETVQFSGVAQTNTVIVSLRQTF